MKKMIEKEIQSDLPLPKRTIGHLINDDGSFTKTIDKLVLHGAPIEFRELCCKAIPETTRYLILDLDRTVHFNRNLGEWLGWELCAYQAYGLDYMLSIQNQHSGKFVWNWKSPIRMIGYLYRSVRLWAMPGLYYLLWGKMASKINSLRRYSFLRFGPEPIRTVQRVPQTALMHHLAEEPVEVLRILSKQVWNRFKEDQVIFKEDIAWLRTRCPRLKIIIASASPKPIVDVAAEMLGVDDIIYSYQEEVDGYLSAPFCTQRLLTKFRKPSHITPPSKLTFNSSFAKVETLLVRYPDLLDPGVEVVGITDNGYGEDSCWAQYFTRVIDINSHSHFAPIVAVTSPLQEVHSAQVLTQGELTKKREGIDEWMDKRRNEIKVEAPREFSHHQLELLLGKTSNSLAELAFQYFRESRVVASAIETLSNKSKEIIEAIEQTVVEYNSATQKGRRRAIRKLYKLLRKEMSFKKKIAKIQRPISEIAFAMQLGIEEAWKLLDKQVLVKT